MAFSDPRQQFDSRPGSRRSFRSGHRREALLRSDVGRRRRHGQLFLRR